MKRTQPRPPNGAAQATHPSLRSATPEALAKALLRPLVRPDPSLRKRGRDSE